MIRGPVSEELFLKIRVSLLFLSLDSSLDNG